MKIALGQLAYYTHNITANLEKHVRFIEQAIAQGADLIVFPELSLTGDMSSALIPEVGMKAEADALHQIAALSHRIDIVIGLAEYAPSNQRYNAAFYFSNGVLHHRHRKLFLVNYAVFEEARHYLPGDHLQAFDTDHGRAAMLVCNDVWHAPAPYLAAANGAELLIVPANSARGIVQNKLDIANTWETMNRTYSATMGFYTVFVNCVGLRQHTYSTYRYWGGSEIIAPDGQVVVKAPYDEEALVIGEVDLAAVARQRLEVPILRDTRPDLLKDAFTRLADDHAAGINPDDAMTA